MLELTLKNFQSYKQETVFNFPHGLTVVTGANNSGKSAILRAINTILTNPVKAKSYISHSKDELFLELNIPDLSFKVSYTRDKAKATYFINNEEYGALKRSSLFDLLPDMPFTKDENNSPICIIDEWTIMFPFNRSDVEMFRLFEDVFALQDSNSVIKNINSSIQDVKAKQVFINSQQQLTLELINKTNEINFNERQSTLMSFHTTLQNKRLKVDLLKSKLPVLSLPLTQITKKDFSFSLAAINQIQKILKNKRLFEFKLIPKEFSFALDSINKKKQAHTKLVQANKFSRVTQKSIQLNTLTLENLLQKRKRLTDLFNALSKISILTTDSEQKQRTIQEKLQELDVCPLCNQNMPLHNLII